MKHPMAKGEAVFGWIWVFVHSLLLGPFLSAVVFPALSGAGFSLGGAELNVAYYGVSFALLMLCLSNFMRASFGELCRNAGSTFVAVAVGYVTFFAAMLLLSFAAKYIQNPNSELTERQIRLNPGAMLAVGVFLAPVVEEVLFRGVVFGTLRSRSRVLAYAVSAAAFSLYHLVDFFIEGFTPGLLLAALEYIPAGLVLCRAYERGKSVYAPIFLHMAINLVSVTVTLNLT